LEHAGATEVCLVRISSAVDGVARRVWKVREVVKAWRRWKRVGLGRRMIRWGGSSGVGRVAKKESARCRRWPRLRAR
jgi:hypothetical protein